MKQSTVVDRKQSEPDPRYEFRVWGEQNDARKLLSDLAGNGRKERLNDCYLLNGDPSHNAKIRHSRLKLKHLEEERLGFQRWSTAWHRVPKDVPEPFDKLLADISRAELRSDDIQHILAEAADGLDGEYTVRAVFVTKRRRLFKIGSMKAEATTVKIEGRPGSLSTVAIEGPDLHELIRLRQTLGLAHAPNLAVHEAVAREFGA